jgi:hypothetical protein
MNAELSKVVTLFIKEFPLLEQPSPATEASIQENHKQYD